MLKTRQRDDKREFQRCCDHPQCKQEGLYKAPKDRSLKEYYWFCLEHVKAYNKSWNYYAGLPQEEIEAQIRLDLVGHRPTWKVNDLYAGRLKDPFDILGLNKTRKKRGPTSCNQKALETTACLEAMQVLQLTAPVNVGTLKTAYKKMAKKYHPDKHGGEKAFEELFKNITVSYHILLKALKE